MWRCSNFSRLLIKCQISNCSGEKREQGQQEGEDKKEQHSGSEGVITEASFFMGVHPFFCRYIYD